MRALVVGGSPDVDPRRVAVLAAASDVVIAADSGGAACLEAGVAPTSVVGDIDSLDGVTLEKLARDGAQIVRHPVEKDETDLDLAVSLAREQGCTRVVFTGITGGRHDHELAALGVVARAHDLHPVVDETSLRGWVLSRLGRREISLTGDSATVSIFALGRHASLRSEGLKWPLDDLRLEPFSSLGHGNVIVGDGARLSWRSGVVLVLSPLVDGVESALEIPES